MPIKETIIGSEKAFILAADPATDQRTLYALYTYAQACIGSSRHCRMAHRILQLLGANPNISLELLAKLLDWYVLTGTIADNPVWPFLALENPKLYGISPIRIWELYEKESTNEVVFATALRLRGYAPTGDIDDIEKGVCSCL